MPFSLKRVQNEVIERSETAVMKSPIIRKCSYLSLEASNLFWSFHRWFSINDLIGLNVQQSNYFLLLIIISIKSASISDGRFAVILFLKYTKIPILSTIWNVTVRITFFSSVLIQTILTISHWFHWHSSFNNTISPMVKFGVCFCHFCLGCRLWRNSFLHLFQNSSGMCWIGSHRFLEYKFGWLNYHVVSWFRCKIVWVKSFHS